MSAVWRCHMTAGEKLTDPMRSPQPGESDTSGRIEVLTYLVAEDEATARAEFSDQVTSVLDTLGLDTTYSNVTVTYEQEAEA